MVRQELVNKGATTLNGDRRCDSPGHSAKYDTYTLMDDDSHWALISSGTA